MATINDVPLPDRTRFATAYLFSKDHQAVDWQSAAAQYDTKIQAASFRTVTQRAFKKANGSKATIPEGDVNRFALCYIFANNKQDVEWTQAAAAYDAKVQAASYRTVTQRALKKVKFAPQTAGAGAKTQKTKKRKAANADEEEYSVDDDVSAKAPKGKARKPGVKTVKKQKVAKTEEEEELSEAPSVDAAEDAIHEAINLGEAVNEDCWNHSPGLPPMTDAQIEGLMSSVLPSTGADENIAASSQPDGAVEPPATEGWTTVEDKDDSITGPTDDSILLYDQLNGY